MSEGPFEAYALRYASSSTRTAVDIYFRFAAYRVPDRPRPTSYYFWLLRRAGEVILVDCGWSSETAQERGRPIDVHPLDLLARMNVRPEDVGLIILSHLHYDHVGNTHLFPNARFILAREELDFWGGPYGERPVVADPTMRTEIEAVQRLHRDGRLTLVDGSAEVVPGVTVARVGGHTPGQLITTVQTDCGQVVLASDALHFSEQLELGWPFAAFVDLQEVFRSFELLGSIDAQPASRVVPGHDPDVAAKYAEIEPECFDLCRSL
ncbi:Glyoxylase, beta-lactamase superfamily II [Microbacterium sp. cf046]|uniref:N-acyl homoserine lactonase family protein n=1 Tax=Microbacterium sp. cf046 TaxID=1761803 RepID=UPI0008E9145C|nr:N-acyl homoserine lactonase family protein [Microbacterium sp. cf046]SFS16722.1 Glyoxylase, beta-lactamase superfamily II [Microbacterium sp. cf046]